MRRYIERDEWRKLSKLLDKNEGLSGERIGKDGKTGLHLAAKLGHEDCLRVLIRGGSKVTAKDRRATTLSTTPSSSALRGMDSALSKRPWLTL